MSRVLFLLPPPEDSIRTVKNDQEGYGLGIPYLSAYLKLQGHETDALLNFHMSYNDYILNVHAKLMFFEPDVVSITMLSTNRVCCYKIIEFVHRRRPNIKIVVGGHHASCMALQLAERYPHIFIVSGEGERALNEMLQGEIQPGIYEATPIQNLDSLPFPDHDLYLKNDPDRKLACILTSRGCPFECSFCALPTISHRSHRRRSVLNVVHEIYKLYTRYPKLEKIAIQDDAFMLDNEWVITFCKQIERCHIHLKFQVAGRVRPVSAELLYWMNKAGMQEVYIGVESGNQSILDRAHKRIRLGDVEHFFNFSKPYPKMIISPYLITGLPGETWDTVKETVRFIKSLQRIRYAFVLNSTPIWAFPGTELWNSFKEAYHITDDYWLGDYNCPNWTVEHNVKELSQMRNYLLNRVSILRIFTPIGFVHQMTNAPYQVLKFLWYHPEYIKYALGGSFGAMFPRLYRKLRGDKIERRFE
jgi:radical SAM superfamily enzyme YgiQ (UPF0313 family)